MKNLWKSDENTPKTLYTIATVLLLLLLLVVVVVVGGKNNMTGLLFLSPPNVQTKSRYVG